MLLGLRRMRRHRRSKALLEFFDARFEFADVLEARFEAVQGFDDARKALILLLTPDAGSHPAIEGPKRKDDDPEFHGASGPESAGHVVDIETVYRESYALGESLGCTRPDGYGRRVDANRC